MAGGVWYLHITQSYPLIFTFFIYNFFLFSTLISGYFWRYLRAWIFSNLMFLEIYGFLVSIGSDLTWVGITVVEILHCKERRCNVENLIALFLKNSFLPIRRRYRQAIFIEGSYPILLQSSLGNSQQLWLDWYRV